MLTLAWPLVRPLPAALDGVERKQRVLHREGRQRAGVGVFLN